MPHCLPGLHFSAMNKHEQKCLVSKVTKIQEVIIFSPSRIEWPFKFLSYVYNLNYQYTCISTLVHKKKIIKMKYN